MNPATAAQTTTPQNTEGGAPVALQPFVRGAMEHVEPLPLDISTSLNTQTLLGLIDVPAFGFLRSVLVNVAATGGTGTAAVYKEDAPWSVIFDISLQDVSGANIVGPITGYQLYLIHKWGSTSGGGNPDPTRQPNYVAPTTAGNFAFTLRLPVEISSRDGLGCLPNQNAASTYKLRVTQAAKADVYSTDATGLPTVRFTAFGEFWSIPPVADLWGRPNAQEPPAMGTTSFWSRQVLNLNSGSVTARTQRVGNMIRTMILVFRTSGTTRSTANTPDPLSLTIDGKLIFLQPRLLQPLYMAERSFATLIDTGVLVFDNTHDWDGILGGDMRDQWIPTTQATRLEFTGAFGAAGTLEILTNDVAPNGDFYIG